FNKIATIERGVKISHLFLLAILLCLRHGLASAGPRLRQPGRRSASVSAHEITSRPPNGLLLRANLDLLPKKGFELEELSDMAVFEVQSETSLDYDPYAS